MGPPVQLRAWPAVFSAAFLCTAPSSCPFSFPAGFLLKVTTWLLTEHRLPRYRQCFHTSSSKNSREKADSPYLGLTPIPGLINKNKGVGGWDHGVHWCAPLCPSTLPRAGRIPGSRQHPRAMGYRMGRVSEPQRQIWFPVTPCNSPLSRFGF